MDKKLHIAIPLLDELNNLPMLFSCIDKQDYSNFTVYLCVNQPDNWWHDKSKVEICIRNTESIKWLKDKNNTTDYEIVIIDKCSAGNGWNGKKIGVGIARKTIMDTIDKAADNDDIIISLDGDTEFNSDYFYSILNYFNNNKNTPCLSVQYYHPLNNDNEANRAILRYEIYMRYYILNLIKIKSPYSFSALGSAIAFKVDALRKIGGFTPKKSGEDFYFLQKMVKYKEIGIYHSQKVFPMARFSDRVFFGTGPAMIKGKEGNWNSYPLYPLSLFKKIEEFYSLIPTLFKQDTSTPLDSFLGGIDVCSRIWKKLRKNNKDLEHFTKAIHDYFDGLRILQFLKLNYIPGKEEKNLIDFLKNENCKELDIILDKNFNFETTSIDNLNQIRDYLCKLEDLNRKQVNHISWKISL